jgi:hypothetical protein
MKQGSFGAWASRDSGSFHVSPGGSIERFCLTNCLRGLRQGRIGSALRSAVISRRASGPLRQGRRLAARAPARPRGSPSRARRAPGRTSTRSPRILGEVQLDHPPDPRGASRRSQPPGGVPWRPRRAATVVAVATALATSLGDVFESPFAPAAPRAAAASVALSRHPVQRVRRAGWGPAHHAGRSARDCVRRFETASSVSRLPGNIL